jgi:hypothetical protein
MTSSAAVVDSCHVHSLSPLAAYDQVRGEGYSKSKVETDDATAFELETDVTPLELEMELDVSLEISKTEQYLADKEWSMLKLLLMGQHQ